MARISASSGAPASLQDLQDYEPYTVGLKSIDFDISSPQYGSERRLMLDWQYGENEDETLRDWISLRLGKNRDSGAVSKLRQLLNALAGKPEGTPIVAFYDDEGDPDGRFEAFQWTYDGKTVGGTLREGDTVVLRGKHGQKLDGTGKFTVTTYQAPAKPAAAARRSAPAAVAEPVEPVAREVDPDEIPFR